MIITRKYKQAIYKLYELHAKYPANDFGFLAGSLGASCAAAARRMESVGLVKVNRMAANCFRYQLTKSGIEFAEQNFADC